MHAHHKSQSAMEYLMTYGWAILIIAVVLSVLFQLGVFSSGNFQPHAQAGACQVSRTVAGVSLEGQCNGLLPQFVLNEPNGQGEITASVPSTATPSAGTITVWFNRKWVTNDGAVHGMLTLGGGCGFPGANAVDCDWNVVQIFKYSDNLWYFRDIAPSSGCQINIADSAISGNVWNQLTFEWGSAVGGLEVWVNDGTPQTCGQSSFPTGWETTNMYLGYGYGENSWEGYLSNIQIYNTTLSSTEVTALYDEGIGGAPIRPQNLVGWYPLNGNANDYSGNNNNGQLNNVQFSSSWENGYTAP